MRHHSNALIQLLFAVCLFSMVGCARPTPAATPTPTLLPTPTAPPAYVVRLANGEWPPFMGENLPHYGYWSHLTTEAFALEGYVVVYDFYPWARVLRNVELGTYEGSPGWAKTSERERLVLFSEPLGELCTVFFHRVDTDFDWHTEADLVGYRIGAVLGFEATERLEALRAQGLALNLDVAEDELTNFKKLLLGRIDIFPAVKDTGLYLLRMNFTPAERTALTYHSQPWGCLENYLIISPESPRADELLQAFARGMQRLRTSGRYDQITQDFLNGAYDTPIK